MQVEAKVKELIGVVKEVSAINGLEVNSKNYLIKGTKGIVVVKIIENTEHSNENTFLAINSRILERNIPAAKLSRIQPLKIGRHTIFFYDYFSGKYYDGSPHNVSLVIKSINVLHDRLSDTNLPFIKSMEPYPSNSNEIFESAILSRTEFNKFLREQTAL